MNVAMSISQEGLDLEPDADFEKRLRELCGLFISIYHGKVYFLHQTAREFLVSEAPATIAIQPKQTWLHSITPEHAHATIAASCVYILDSFNSFSCTDTDVSESEFFWYAADYWHNHARQKHMLEDDALIPTIKRICNK